MRVNRTALAAVVAGMLVVGACGDDGDSSASTDGTSSIPADAGEVTTTGSSDSVDDAPSIDDIEATLLAAHPSLFTVVAFTGRLFPDVAGELPPRASAGVDTIQELLDALPPAVELGGDGPSTFDTMRERLVDWQAALRNMIDAVEADGDQMQLEADAWIDGGRESEPPRSVTDLLTVNSDAGHAYVAACEAFAVAAGIAPDCASVVIDPESSPS